MSEEAQALVLRCFTCQKLAEIVRHKQVVLLGQKIDRHWCNGCCDRLSLDKNLIPPPKAETSKQRKSSSQMNGGQREDAAKNHKKVIAAAQKLFRSGEKVTHEKIEREAGVHRQYLNHKPKLRSQLESLKFQIEQETGHPVNFVIRKKAS